MSQPHFRILLMLVLGCFFFMVPQMSLSADGPGPQLRTHMEMHDVPVSTVPPEIQAQLTAARAQQPGERPLRLKTGDVVPEPGLDTALNHLAGEGTGASTYVIVQYARDPQPDELAELAAGGYERLDYLPEDGFVVRVAADTLAVLAEQPFVRAVVPLRPAWKLDPQLAAAIAHDPVAAQDVTMETFEPLILPEDSTLERVGKRLRYAGRLTVGEIDRYLRDPLVQWVELQPVIRPATADAVRIAAVDNVWGQTLDGSGVQVGVIDSGIEAAHSHFNTVPHIIYATDHVDGGVPDDTLGHGTHVAGIVAGEGTFNGQTFRGVAPDADLIVERVLDENDDWQGGSDYAALYDDVADLGADLINNSWGAPSNGDYRTLARDADAWARDHPNVALVFANGNGSMDTPAIAKNVIAVGAIDDGTPGDYVVNAEYADATTADDVDLVSNLNDILPPDDGRVKPDINAPGEWVTAPALLSASETYTTWRGTSMATPYVAGIIALYKDAYGEAARTELIKAALINSAVPLGAKPGQTAWAQGWGRVQAFDFIYRLGPLEVVDGSFIDSVTDGETDCNHLFTVPPGAEQVRATLAYLDRPASLNANPTQVNEVNMWLSDGSTAYPALSPGDGTVAFVRVLDPTAATWQICVSGTDLPMGGSQDLAVVYSVLLEDDATVDVTVPASVVVPQNSVFDLDIAAAVGTDDWFAYGTWAKVETLHSSLSLNAGSREGWIAGDLLQETWQPEEAPEFVASACGTFNNAIKVTVGGTNFATITRYVDVTVAWCDGYEEDDSATLSSWIYDGTTQQHMIVPSNDEDWAKFSLSRSSGVVLETSSSSFPTADTRLWLYDGSLNEEDYNDDKVPGSEYYSLIERTCEVDPLPAGLYYVKVDEYGNNAEIWDYDLSLDVTPCSGPEHTVYLPAVLRNYDPSLLFFDDFSDPGSGWPQVLDQTDYRLAYLNGEYQVDENADQLRIPNAPVTCERCSIEVDARFASIEYSGYGLAFAKKGNTFYMFTGWPNADYCYVHKYDGSWTTLQEGACVLSDATNHLRVEWDAPAIRAYANGTKVFDLSDGSFSGARMPSVVVWGTGDARFDNFEVWRLP